MITMSLITLSSNVVVNSDHVSSDLDGETIILDAKSGQYYGLDGAAGRVWSLIEQPMTVQVVCDRIVSEYEVDPDRCQVDVVTLLQELFDEGLVILSTDSSA